MARRGQASEGLHAGLERFVGERRTGPVENLLELAGDRFHEAFELRIPIGAAARNQVELVEGRVTTHSCFILSRLRGCVGRLRTAILTGGP